MLTRVFDVDIVDSFNCMAMRPTQEREYGVRCCYDASDFYIPSWPSRLVIGKPDVSRWNSIEEEEVERIACEDLRGDSAFYCEQYQQRRPSAPGTNDAYHVGSWWNPRRPFGGGWGDPHCITYDGMQYECNFVGEAVWTSCGDWMVHVVAEPVGTGIGTAITKFSVRYKMDTIIGKLKSEEEATNSSDPNDRDAEKDI